MNSKDRETSPLFRRRLREMPYPLNDEIIMDIDAVNEETINVLESIFKKSLTGVRANNSVS